MAQTKEQRAYEQEAYMLDELESFVDSQEGFVPSDSVAVALLQNAADLVLAGDGSKLPKAEAKILSDQIAGLARLVKRLTKN